MPWSISYTGWAVLVVCTQPEHHFCPSHHHKLSPTLLRNIPLYLHWGWCHPPTVYLYHYTQVLYQNEIQCHMNCILYFYEVMTAFLTRKASHTCILEVTVMAFSAIMKTLGKSVFISCAPNIIQTNRTTHSTKHRNGNNWKNAWKLQLKCWQICGQFCKDSICM